MSTNLVVENATTDPINLSILALEDRGDGDGLEECKLISHGSCPPKS